MLILRRWRRVLACLVAAGAVLALGPNAFLRLSTWGDRYGDADATPARPVALVLGAGIRGTQPSPFLQQRLDLAVELYRQGRVRALLVTGDHGRDAHNEPGVMKAYAVAQGVPAVDVVEDHAGFSTYDSCVRARKVFGVTAAVVVTQGYHLPRAVFTCQHSGIDAVGLGGSMLDAHRDKTIRFSLRELAGSGKAAWQVLISKPEPHFLGDKESGIGEALAD